MTLAQEKLKIGQVVRFKNYKRNEAEKEAYFVVIQEENATNEMVLFTINSNRIYITGTTLLPEFPEEDLRLVDLRPSDLVNQELTINEITFNEVVTGIAVYFPGDNDVIQFKQIGTALVSDAVFEFSSDSEHRLMGPLNIAMEYENTNQ
jgi:hypothetical protein